jgi:hypothetical protein
MRIWKCSLIIIYVFHRPDMAIAQCQWNFNVIVGREIAKVPLEYVTVALTILPPIGIA